MTSEMIGAVESLLGRWSRFRAWFWDRLGSRVTRAPGDSQLLGARRDGRVCVGVFKPPDAAGQFASWREANEDRYGPASAWHVDNGHVADGRDFVMVWVPIERAHARD